MNRFTRLSCAALLAVAGLAAAGSAQLAPPPIPAAAKMQATPYLETAGMSDVYEITSSQIALQKSRNPDIRRFATMLIGDHTMTTDQALAAAKAGGVTAPPPVLNAQFRALIAELGNASGPDFDRLYIGQQIPAHQGALELQTAYAANGDVAQLRTAARGAVPVIRMHLDDAMKLQGRMGRM